MIARPARQSGPSRVDLIIPPTGNPYRACSRLDRGSGSRCPPDPWAESRTEHSLHRGRVVVRFPAEGQAAFPFGGLYVSEGNRREANRRGPALVTQDRWTAMFRGRENGLAMLRTQRSGAVSGKGERGAPVGPLGAPPVAVGAPNGVGGA